MVDQLSITHNYKLVIVTKFTTKIKEKEAFVLKCSFWIIKNSKKFTDPRVPHGAMFARSPRLHGSNLICAISALYDRNYRVFRSVCSLTTPDNKQPGII